jgi:hypothetical protein
MIVKANVELKPLLLRLLAKPFRIIKTAGMPKMKANHHAIENILADTNKITITEMTNIKLPRIIRNIFLVVSLPSLNICSLSS